MLGGYFSHVFFAQIDHTTDNAVGISLNQSSSFGDVPISDIVTCPLFPFYQRPNKDLKPLKVFLTLLVVLTALPTFSRVDLPFVFLFPAD